MSPPPRKPFKVTVPGKAMLAGEYAILHGAPALACAVERFLTCEAEPAARWSIERLENGHCAQGADLSFAEAALHTARSWLEGEGRAVAPLRLRLSDALRSASGAKLGLGGSAAATVAVTAATLSGAGENPRPELLFALAATAHASGQSTPGSGVDVAACVHGGILWVERAFDFAPLRAALDEGPSAFARALARAPLPRIERIRSELSMALAFTGRSASTGPLLSRVGEWRARAPERYASFVEESRRETTALRAALEGGNARAAVCATERLDEALVQLGQDSGAPLIVEEHRSIAAEARACGAAAKICGAGGGDCSLLVGDEAALARACERLRAWRLEIVPLPAGAGIPTVGAEID